MVANWLITAIICTISHPDRIFSTLRRRDRRVYKISLRLCNLTPRSARPWACSFRWDKIPVGEKKNGEPRSFIEHAQERARERIISESASREQVNKAAEGTSRERKERWPTKQTRGADSFVGAQKAPFVIRALHVMISAYCLAWPRLSSCRLLLLVMTTHVLSAAASAAPCVLRWTWKKTNFWLVGLFLHRLLLISNERSTQEDTYTICERRGVAQTQSSQIQALCEWKKRAGEARWISRIFLLRLLCQRTHKHKRDRSHREAQVPTELF